MKALWGTLALCGLSAATHQAPPSGPTGPTTNSTSPPAGEVNFGGETTYLPADVFPDLDGTVRNDMALAIDDSPDPWMPSTDLMAKADPIFKRQYLPKMAPHEASLFKKQAAMDSMIPFPNGKLPKFDVADEDERQENERKKLVRKMEARGRRIQELTQYVTSGSVWLTELESKFNKWVEDEREKGRMHIEAQRQQLNKIREELRTRIHAQRADAKMVNLINAQLLTADTSEDIQAKKKQLRDMKNQLKLRKRAMQDLAADEKQLAADIANAKKALAMNKNLLEQAGLGDLALLPGTEQYDKQLGKTGVGRGNSTSSAGTKKSGSASGSGEAAAAGSGSGEAVAAF